MSQRPPASVVLADDRRGRRAVHVRLLLSTVFPAAHRRVTARRWSRRFLVAIGTCGVVVAIATPPTDAGAPARSRATTSESAARVTFTVDTDAGRKPISPLIYGVNADLSVDHDFTAVLTEARPGLVRLGGDRWTAYNWETNASNAGSDYEYENDDFLSSSPAPGAAVLPTVTAAEAAGIAALVTIPIAGYVSADTGPPGDVRTSGANYLQTRFKIDRAIGPRPTSTTPDLSNRFVSQSQFVAWLRKSAPKATVLFSLDNEPELWSSTHEEVHPKAATYAEVLSKDLAYAAAVKKIWPSALVTGPVSYGWEGYETLQNAPDAAKDGNFLDWWLAHVRRADAAAHMRLIDDLDLHWYPEATGAGVRITGTDTTSALRAAREQAPRSLWDPTYVERSWITEDSLGGKAIDLIPRLRQQIRAHDPGMNLDFSEWNYGGGNDISGAIATADVLGIFGREGVHAAAVWPLNSDERFTDAAFAMFRNYDGHGAAFGDTEVKATTTDPVTTSVYASIDRANPDHVVIVAINKRDVPVPVAIDLEGDATATSVEVFRLTAASARPRRAGTVGVGASGVVRTTLPAQSVSVLVPSAT